MGDLIRLDSTTSLSPVDEFDPLIGAAPSRLLSIEPEESVAAELQTNPVYTLHFPPRQTAEPQAPPAASNGVPSFKGYTGRFTTGADPFSNLLAFTRSNFGSPTAVVAGDGAELADESRQDTKLTSQLTSSWTTFD